MTKPTDTNQISPTSSAINTLYGEIDPDIFEALKSIELAVFDVDGVFSDGSIYLGSHGEELKAFNTKDGFGMKALVDIGIKTAIITGRESSIVESRMSALNVSYIYQSRVDKRNAIKELLQDCELSSDKVLSMGDDVPDIGMFEHSRVKVAVSDAHPSVKLSANYVCTLGGGKGAVREVCDMILQAKGKLHSVGGASV